MSERVLILGGTAEARALAEILVAQGRKVISSLAGRVQRPRLPVGETRVGGFGGPEGLARWVAEHDIGAVVDATHPFAARISASAVEAARRTGTPLLRLQRPGWLERPGDDWRRVPTIDDAARLLPSVGTRVFLTTGRQDLPTFFPLTGLWFLARCVDAPAEPPPPHVELLLARGPYTLDAERGLMLGHRLDVVVTKDSGGPLTEAKLDAARELGLPVVVVERPPRPDAPTVATPDEAAAWVENRS